MNFAEMQAAVFLECRDYDRERVDPLLIEYRLNRGLVEFNQATRLVRGMATVTITNGVGNLRPTPDNILVSGDILRVEDAQTGRALQRTTEKRLDVLKSKLWRTQTTGSMSHFMEGLSPDAVTPSGYATLLVYPVVPSGSCYVHYVATPRAMASDGDTCEIPEYLQEGIVFHAALAILTGEARPDLEKQTAYVQSRYADFVARGKAKTAEWIGTGT